MKSYSMGNVEITNLNKWNRVKDGHPKFEKDVFIISKGQIRIAYLSLIDIRGCVFYNSNGSYLGIEYWLPIPKVKGVENEKL